MIPRRRWAIAVLLGIGVLVNYLDRVNLSVARDALHAEFGLSNEQFGLLSSAFNWTYALLQLPMGVLLDRFGVFLLGSIGAFLWAVASFGSALAPGIKTFYASRLLLGIGEAPSFPGNSKAVGYWFPRSERSLATAIFDGAAKFGPAVGVLFVGALTIHFGWRFTFGATGFISFLFFVAFFFLYRDPKDDPKLSPEELRFITEGGAQPSVPHSQQAPSAPLSYLLARKKVIGLVLGMFAYNYVFYLLLYWMPTYFRSLNLSPGQSVIYSSVPWIVATLCDLLIGGWLVDALVRRGHPETVVRQSVLIGGTLLGLAVAGAQTTRDPVIAVIWVSVAIGGLSAAAPVGWSVPSLIAPRNSVGKVGGILNFGNQVAGIASSIATGYLAGKENAFGRAFLAAGIILVSGICAYVFLLGRIEQVPEPGAHHSSPIYFEK